MNSKPSSEASPSLDAKIETLTRQVEELKQRHERYSLLTLVTCLAALLTSNFLFLIYKLVLNALSFEAFVNHALVGMLGAIIATLFGWLSRNAKGGRPRPITGVRPSAMDRSANR